MIKRLLLVTIAVSMAFCSFAQTDTTSYSIMFGGLVKGFWKLWKNADGTYSEWFQYNDRGRGDSMRSVYRIDEQGFPLSAKSAGVDYMKNPVFEDFSWENGTAKWKSNGESDQRAVTGKAFYTGAKTTVGNMYKALKTNGNKIQLLPFGEANLSVLKTHTVGRGAGATKITLVSVAGMNLTPTYTWIDDKDDQFASVSDWFNIIRAGYEKYIPELLAMQKAIENAYFSNIARKLTQKPTSVLIRNVDIFDAVNATLIKDADVLVERGIVKTISPGKRLDAGGAKQIDGKGKTLLPGLWDMHVHLSTDLDGIMHVASGVTHVRDMGNDSSLLVRARKMREGSLVGPNVEIMSGFIDGAGPLAAPTGKLINNVDEGIKFIREYAKLGYQQIKLYSSIKPEWVKPLADEAHKHNMRVAGHIPAFMIARQAIDAGYDEVTHLNMLALDFFGDTIDTRSPNRFKVPAQYTAGIPLDGEAMKKLIAILKEKKIAVDPTVGVFESLFTARDGKMEEKFIGQVDRFPATIQRSLRAGGGGLPVPEGMDATYRQSFDAFLKITKLLYDSGITIVAGTDGLPGFDLHHELELYVKAGIAPEKVLQLATYGTAVYTGKQNQYGSVAAGRYADFVIVDGNPLTNISDIRKTRWVMKREHLYEAGGLFQSISILP